MTLRISSPSFRMGDAIPPRHSFRGGNISPEIHWEDVPDGTRSLVLIMEDPDIPIPKFILPVWTHWIVYNIDGSRKGLPEGIPCAAGINGFGMQAVTSFRKTGYSGPCPPFGTHRYFFRIYALDTFLDLKPESANRKEVLRAMEGHILQRGELMGIFSRKA